MLFSSDLPNILIARLPNTSNRFDAILPPGTGAILAVAASRPTVVAGKDGSIAVKKQMQVNLTADHRVIYGADGAAFLKDLAELIETRPEVLALS